MNTLPTRNQDVISLPSAYAPLLEGLKEWLDGHDYTGRSRTTYLSLLHRFLTHLAEWEIPFEELTSEDLQAFFAEAGLKPASRNLYLVMLGHLYESRGQTEDNPVTRYKTVASRRRGGRGRTSRAAAAGGTE